MHPSPLATTEGSSRHVAFATGVAAIDGFLFGYDTAVINGANTYLTSHFHLNAAQQRFAVASAILGGIPETMFAGSLSDRYGRHRLPSLFESAQSPLATGSSTTSNATRTITADT